MKGSPVKVKKVKACSLKSLEPVGATKWWIECCCGWWTTREHKSTARSAFLTHTALPKKGRGKP